MNGKAGVEPARHRGLPSPELTLIFTLDDPLVLASHPDPAQAPGTYDSIAGGLHTAPAIITHEGRQSGVQLGLSPLGARMLLGMPAGELAEIDVAAEEVLGSLATEVRDRLRTATTWPGRFAILDEVLTARAARGAARAGAGVSPEVAYAWRKLLRTGGATAVGVLAAETGWSERHLRARFREETGLGPTMARSSRSSACGSRRGAGPGGSRRRLRLLRPGAPGSRVRAAGRLRSDYLAGRGVPKLPIRRRVGAARLAA